MDERMRHWREVLRWVRYIVFSHPLSPETFRERLEHARAHGWDECGCGG